jgi:hypothetical protein
MDHPKIPIRHEYKKAYKNALSWVWMCWGEMELEEVSATLKENGWTDEHIDNTMYFRSSFFAS